MLPNGTTFQKYLVIISAVGSRSNRNLKHSKKIPAKHHRETVVTMSIMLSMRKQPGIPPAVEQPSSMFSVFHIAPLILSLPRWPLNTQGHTSPKTFLVTCDNTGVSSSGYAFLHHKLVVNE